MFQNFLGPTFNAISHIIDELFTSQEERDKAHLSLKKLAQKGELEKMRMQISTILAEAQSKDAWTSRARPTFLYLMYLMIILCFIGAILGIWFPKHMFLAADHLNALLTSIPESLWWLFGAGYLGYTGARSIEKIRPHHGKYFK